MSEPKTAACKFIEAKTITIPGPGKFPEVEPTTVKNVKRDDEDKDEKEASSNDLMRQAFKQAQNSRPYGTPKPSSATAAQKKMIADANKPPPGGTVGPRSGPGDAKSYRDAEKKLFPAGHVGMTTPAGTGSAVANKPAKPQHSQVVKRGNSPSPTDIGDFKVEGLGPTAETMAGLTGIPAVSRGSIGNITSGDFISKSQWLQVLARLGLFAGGGAGVGALISSARGKDVRRGASVGAVTGLGAMYGQGAGGFGGALVGGAIGSQYPVEGATVTGPGADYSSEDDELEITGEPVTKDMPPTAAGIGRGTIIGSGVGQGLGAVGGGMVGYNLGQELFGDEDDERREVKLSAAQPADQTPRHHCHGVHPDQTHEEWKASLEKDKGEKQSALKRAFSAGRMGQWLEEPRPLNPDEDAAAKRGKKRWRAPRGPNPELSEMMRSPWRAALGGAGMGGLVGGVGGAGLGAAFGLGGDMGAGSGALAGAAAFGGMGALGGGVDAYQDQQEANELIQQLMRHQSEERATVSDLERNLIEEEQRQRSEWAESRKQAAASSTPGAIGTNKAPSSSGGSGVTTGSTMGKGPALPTAFATTPTARDMMSRKGRDYNVIPGDRTTHRDGGSLKGRDYNVIPGDKTTQQALAAPGTRNPVAPPSGMTPEQTQNWNRNQTTIANSWAGPGGNGIPNQQQPAWMQAGVAPNEQQLNEWQGGGTDTQQQQGVFDQYGRPAGTPPGAHGDANSDGVPDHLEPGQTGAPSIDLTRQQAIDAGIFEGNPSNWNPINWFSSDVESNLPENINITEGGADYDKAKEWTRQQAGQQAGQQGAGQQGAGQGSNYGFDVDENSDPSFDADSERGGLTIYPGADTTSFTGTTGYRIQKALNEQAREAEAKEGSAKSSRACRAFRGAQFAQACG